MDRTVCRTTQARQTIQEVVIGMSTTISSSNRRKSIFTLHVVILLSFWSTGIHAATSYRYDQAGRIIQATREDGLTYQYDYDPRGNLATTSRLAIPDSDRDLLPDSVEIDDTSCPFIYDADSDDDGIADGLEDSNRNGLVDPGETSPCNPDSDNDGIQDGTELGITEPVADPDDAGPMRGTDLAVFQPDLDPTTTTDPRITDSDGDGIVDGDEDTNHNGRVDSGESSPVLLQLHNLAGTALNGDGSAPFGQTVTIKAYTGSSCDELALIDINQTDATTGAFSFANIPVTPVYLFADTAGTTALPQWYRDGSPASSCGESTVILSPSEPNVSGLNFHLQSGYPLSGTIYQNDGSSPVSEQLQLHLYADNGCTGSFVKTIPVRSDTGRYSITGLPSGSYALYIEAPASDYVSRWYASGGDGYGCEDATVISYDNTIPSPDHDILLARGKRLAGTVYASDNTTRLTAKRLYIEIFHEASCSGFPLTDTFVDPENAEYITPPLHPGNYYLRLRDLDGNFFTEWWSTAGDGFVCGQAEAAVLTDSDRDGIDFQLDQATAGSTIFGRVTGLDGLTPVPEPMQLWLSRDNAGCGDGFVAVLPMNSDGSYRFNNLADGSYRVRAYHDDSEQRPEWWSSTNDDAFNCEESELLVLTGTEQRSRINFALHNLGVISGTLRDTGGNVIGAEHLMVRAAIGTGACSAEERTVAFVDETDGSYRLSQLYPGTYYLLAEEDESCLFCEDSDLADEWWSPEGNAYSCRDGVAVEITLDDEISGKDFNLDTGNSLSGGFYDRNGDPLELMAPYIYIYRGLSACSAELVERLSPGIFGSTDYVTLGLPPGIYWLRVTGYNYLSQWYRGDGNGLADCHDAEPIIIDQYGQAFEGLDFHLYDCSNYPDLPTNDYFDQPTISSGGSWKAHGNNYCTDVEPGEPEHGGEEDSASVWFTWTAPVSGWYRLITEGSLFDTVLGVYTGTAVNSLSLMGQSNNVAGGLWSEVIFQAQAATAYQMAVGGWSGATGIFDLQLEPLAGDLDGNFNSDMTDLVFGLQTSSGGQPSGLTIHGDVNADNRIGQPESLWLMNRLSADSQAGPCIPEELSENNAGDWEGWAESGQPGATYAEEDPTMTAPSGSSLASVKFVTDGAYDTYIRYPGYTASWDLSQTETLTMSIRSENDTTFQAGPVIRLVDADGNYFEYNYYQNEGVKVIVDDARDNWIDLEIPLNAKTSTQDGWTVSLSGMPDISDIRYLEIHADTWGDSFILWLDEVRFSPQPGCTRP